MRAVVAGVVLLTVAAASVAQDAAPTVRETPSSWTPIAPGFRHLKLAAGWQLYPCRYELGDFPPFAVAARESERAAGQGFRVTHRDLGRYLDGGATSPEAAVELLVFALGATLVPDVATLERLVATASRLQATCPGEYVKTVVHDYRPASVGATATATEDGSGWMVTAVVYETHRIHWVSQVRARVTRAGALVATVAADTTFVVDRTLIVTGPPSSWQTCLERTENTEEGRAQVDAAIARDDANRAHVERLARAFRVACDARRTLTHIRPLVQPGTTMDAIRAALGPPDRDVGSGLHMWVYDLHDGTAVVFGDSGRGPLSYAHHVDRAERTKGGLAGPMRTLEDLTPK